MVCVLEGEILILDIAFENNEYNVNDKPIILKTDFIINFKNRFNFDSKSQNIYICFK